jgi:hypothetical protein
VGFLFGLNSAAQKESWALDLKSKNCQCQVKGIAMYAYNSVSQKEMFEKQARFEAWLPNVFTSSSWQEQELQRAANEGLGVHLVKQDEDSLDCHFCGGDDTILLDSSSLPVCVRCMHNSLRLTEVLLLEANEDINKLYEQIRFLVPLVVWSYGQDHQAEGVVCDCCQDTFSESGIVKIDGSEKVKNMCWQCLGATTELYLLGGSLPAEIISGYPEGHEPPEVEVHRTYLREREIQKEESIIVEGHEYKSSFRDRKHILLPPLF